MKTEFCVVSLDQDAEKIDPKTNFQWIHLLTMGVMNARDGRVFELRDPEQVIKTTLAHAGKMELPVDFEHQTDLAPQNGQPAPAAGWMKKFEVRKNGIWALVHWTDIAAQMIKNREYRYISPTFRTNRAGLISFIDRAALTNRPALELTQIAMANVGGKEIDDMEFEGLTFEQKIAVLMGMDAKAGDDDIISTLQALMNGQDAIDGADVTAVASLLQTISQERSEAHMVRVRDKVSTAVMGGTMPPSMRGWMTRLCTQDEAAFDEFVRTVGTPFAYLFKSDGDPTAKPATNTANVMDTKADEGIARQLGIDPKSMRP